MKSLLIASSLLLAVSLTACNSRQPQVVEVQPQQPQVVVQQQPQVVAAQPVYVQPQQPVIVQQDNSANNLATGMILGAAMSGGGRDRTVVVHHYSPSVAPAPVIVNKTVINRTVVAAPAYRAPMATSNRGSYSSYSRTTTTTRR